MFNNILQVLSFDLSRFWIKSSSYKYPLPLPSFEEYLAMQESSSLETLQFRGIVSYHRKREGGVRFSTGSCVNTMGLISWKCKPIPRVCTRRTVSSSARPFYSPPSYTLSPLFLVLTFSSSLFSLNLPFLFLLFFFFFFIFNYITHFFPLYFIRYDRT